jgi:hypothetical protein
VPLDSERRVESPDLLLYRSLDAPPMVGQVGEVRMHVLKGFHLLLFGHIGEIG